MALRSFWYIFLLNFLIVGIHNTQAQVQRGYIIRTASTPVMDPNQDRYVSGRNPNTGIVTPNTPFSNIGYYVPEFEIPMFGLPKVGAGDVPGDNIGQICGVTDLIPDQFGYSVYATRDPNNNLIFRFRVGSDRPSVEGYSILIDTDGLFGASDPNATGNNPGFELLITLIKRNNAGVRVYNIDGIDGCPSPVLSYPIGSHFQISVADEVTCGNLDYFYDFYVPFGEIASAVGINEFTGLRFAAVTTVSATCAFGGKIADISGVDYNDYKDCIPCAFNDIIAAQCPTPIVDLRADGPGFDLGLLSAPSIDEPIRAGQTTVSGGAEAGVYINLRIFSRTGGTDAAPVWSSSPRETHTVFVPAGTWQVDLDGPLQAYDRIVARAQKSPDGNECGLGAGNEASSTSITVVEPNEIPEAFDQFVEVEIDNFVEIDLIATDADGDPLSFIISSCPANGVLRDAITNLVIDCSAPFSLSSNRVRYTPNASYLGPDSFTFMANDGAANSNLATISIDVIPINNPPIADDQSVETDEDIQVDITLTGTDPDGDALSFIIVAQPSHGTLSGAGANQTYTPNPGYSGNDSFTFKVNDGRIDSEIATVSITVNPVNKPPVAVPLASDQCIEVMEDTPGAIVLQASDPDGDALTYIIVTPPSHGTLSGTAPNLTYTPEANYFGPDEFTFKVNDGEFDSNVASVCIEVIGVNDPPFITGSVSIVNYVFGNGGVLLDNTLQVNDPDDATIEGVEVSISSNFKVGDELLLTTEPGITASYNAATGELSLLGTASLAAYSATISSIIFLNDAEDPLGAPTRRISFIARDQQESGPVYHIFVSYPGNTAPVADDVEDPNCIELDEDTPHIINLSASDADGDNLNFIIVTPPSHGTLTGSGPEFTYTPDQDYFGPDSFTFKVNDGTDDSNIAEVCLNVLPVNDPPVAVDDTATTTTNVAITFNITDNDFDVDGNIEPSTVDLDPSSPGQQKTFTVEAEGIYEVDNAGNLTFTPAFNYQGVASAIFYTVEDNDGAVSNQASIIVTVNLGQLRPVAVDDVADTQLNTPITFNITDNDFDPDGQIEPSTVDLDPSIAGEQKTYAVTGEGNFSVDNSGNVSFTPAADFTGTVVIIYTLKDNDGLLSNEATISVNVVDPASANTAPLAEDLELEVQQNTPKDFSLAASDADDDPLTFIIVTNPANGTLSGTGPAFTYTPNTDYLGADEFTYKVNDGTEDSNVATVSITVIQDTSAPENRAPRIAPIPVLYTPMDSSLLICLSVTDLDGDNITYNQPTKLSGEGTMLLSQAFGFCFLYTPDQGFSGESVWNMSVCDDGVPVLCDDIDVTIVVLQAPVAVNDSSTTFVNIPVTFNILANDFAPDTELMPDSVDLNPATPEFEKQITVPAAGEFSVDDEGNVTFVPLSNFSGEVLITYIVKDDYGVPSNEASIKVSVELAPIPANPNDLFFDVLEDVPTEITLTAPVNDGEELTYIVLTQPANGTLSGNAPDLVYLSNLNYNGPDQFTFRVNNGFNNSEIATAFINVIPVNDPPSAVNDTVTVQNDQSITFNALANDFDIDGDNIFMDVVPLSGPSHGTVTFQLDGTVTYTPFETYVGQDIIQYRIFDDGDPVLDNTAFIIVNVVLPPFKIYNAISANGDGQNDYWRIDAIESYTNNHVRVFDRYNNLVFEMKAYRNNDVQKSFWGEANRGLSNGVKLAEGTYYYVVDIGDGSRPVSGYLMLKRN